VAEPTPPLPEVSPSTLASILITPVLSVIRLANETLEERGVEMQRHLAAMVEMRFAHIMDKLGETDVRYQQRFEAQKEALTAAFLAQQTAMGTALTAAEKAVTAALAAADRAVTKAEIASEKRFESVNEFRAVLTEQSKTLTTRTEVDVAVKGLTEKVDAAIKGLTDKIDQQAALFHAQALALEKRLTLQEGKQEGIGTSWAVVAAIVGFLLAAIGIAVALFKR